MNPNQPNPNPAPEQNSIQAQPQAEGNNIFNKQIHPAEGIKNFIFKKRSKIGDFFLGFFFHLISYIISVFLFVVIFIGLSLIFAFALKSSESGAEGVGFLVLFGVIGIVILAGISTFVLDIIIACMKKSAIFFIGALVVILLPLLLSVIFSGGVSWGSFDPGILIIDKIIEF